MQKPPRASPAVFLLCVLGLAAFLAAEALLLRAYIRTDTRPPAWDQAVHMEIALDYREALGAGRWADAWYLAPKSGMPPFPPVYHLLLKGAYSFPDPARAALWVNLGYLAVLAVALFGISWRFLPDSRALAGTIAFCAAPGIQDLLVNQLVDLPLVACAAAAYWALLACEGFTLLLPSLAFGALHALGMLHKWSFFSYMLPAYAAALYALGEARTRWRMLLAAAVSGALSAPWYWSHAALLPSRLVQATADFAIPFWRQGAWATYLSQASEALGPVLWGLGLIGLLAPQYARRREQGGLVGWWFASSYVFWTVVPNRQLRFLLPGLPPVGLAFAATWPRWLTWGVALFQLGTMVNFYYPLLQPAVLQTPVGAVTFFMSRPAAREDWRLEEILRRAEERRDPGRPLTNLTLVANDTYFNAPTMHWAQRYLGLEHVRLRSVNKRLCELSEFVLLKKGDLGPSSVIGGLPQAQETIEEPGGWFSAAYEEDGRWPLPDGSEAVLYRQRRGRPRPLDKRRVEYALFNEGRVTAEGARADFGEWDKDLSAWRDARVSVRKLDVRGLALRGVSADLKNFSFVPLYRGAGGFSWSDARLMRLDSVRLTSLEVGEADLEAFLEKRVPGLILDTLALDGTVRAAGRYKGRPVSLEAALELDRDARRLRVRVLSASVVGLPLPVSLFRPIKELSLSLAPNPETPFDIELAGLTIKDGKLTVP